MPSIRATLDDLLNRPDMPLSTLLDRDFSPNYRQRTNGHWDDLSGFRETLIKLQQG
ncbi:MAG: hypothetical protein ACK4ZD_15305 [Caldimonas sp.]|uniref:hypothetical protein n=1 Tax=Caldimonas sp. TaxID=2838790 RepID=UPI00391C298C